MYIIACFFGEDFLENGQAAASGSGAINAIMAIELFSKVKPGSWIQVWSFSRLLSRLSGTTSLPTLWTQHFLDSMVLAL